MCLLIVLLVICVFFVPSVLWYCWLGLLTCKTVSQITYTVLVETLNPAQSFSQNQNHLSDNPWTLFCTLTTCCIVDRHGDIGHTQGMLYVCQLYTSLIWHRAFTETTFYNNLFAFKFLLHLKVICSRVNLTLKTRRCGKLWASSRSGSHPVATTQWHSSPSVSSFQVTGQCFSWPMITWHYWSLRTHRC